VQERVFLSVLHGAMLRLAYTSIRGST
jgi:hypothetical protein